MVWSRANTNFVFRPPGTVPEDMLMGLAHEQMLMGLAHEQMLMGQPDRQHVSYSDSQIGRISSIRPAGRNNILAGSFIAQPGVAHF